MLAKVDALQAFIRPLKTIADNRQSMGAVTKFDPTVLALLETSDQFFFAPAEMLPRCDALDAPGLEAYALMMPILQMELAAHISTTKAHIAELEASDEDALLRYEARMTEVTKTLVEADRLAESMTAGLKKYAATASLPAASAERPSQMHVSSICDLYVTTAQCDAALRDFKGSRYRDCTRANGMDGIKTCFVAGLEIAVPEAPTMPLAEQRADGKQQGVDADSSPSRPAVRERDGMPVAYFDGSRFGLGISDAEAAKHLRACESAGKKGCGQKFKLEKPPVEVSLSAYGMDKFEVSRAQYGQCADAGGCASVDYSACSVYTESRKFSRGARLPSDLRVDAAPQACVTRDEAAQYCRWAGGELPSEAQWELAAGGDARVFPWGDEFDPSRLRFLGDDKVGRVAAVDAYPKGATPEGLHHMAGNMYEWVQGDACSYDEFRGGRDPICRSGESKGVVRGGSYLSGGESARVTSRKFTKTDVRVSNFGFRCAMPVGL